MSSHAQPASDLHPLSGHGRGKGSRRPQLIATDTAPAGDRRLIAAALPFAGSRQILAASKSPTGGGSGAIPRTVRLWMLPVLQERGGRSPSLPEKRVYAISAVLDDHDKLCFCAHAYQRPRSVSDRQSSLWLTQGAYPYIGLRLDDAIAALNATVDELCQPGEWQALHTPVVPLTAIWGDDPLRSTRAKVAAAAAAAVRAGCELVLPA